MVHEFSICPPSQRAFLLSGILPGGGNMILLLLFNLSFHPSQADTVHVYRQPEVVVTATRTPINSIDAPSRVTQIDISEMRDNGFDDAIGLLSFVDGIFVKNYGPTQIATISMRGTKAEQTLFLFDGVSLNNVQNGQLDLFLVPTNAVGSIEISQGGLSALYGANAVGGVVNLQSKTTSENMISLNLDEGSYGNQTIGGELSEGLGPVRVDLIVQRQRGVNDFDFTFNNGTRTFPMKLIGADFVEDIQSLKVSIPTTGGVTSFLIQNVSANRGTPYAIFDSASVGTARELDRSTLAILRNSGSLGMFQYSASGGFIYSYLQYTDPTYASNDYYKMLSFQPAGQLSYIDERLSMAAGLDAEIDRGESDKMSGIKDRNRVGVFLSGEYGLRTQMDMETRFFAALRFDDYTQFGSSFNPKAGLNIKPIAAVPFHIRANVGSSFRVPTFNDLYYSDPYYNGNANLKPEKSIDYDLGAVVDFHFDRSPVYGNFNLDYYHIETRDGIALEQLSSGSSTEINLQKVVSRGIEVSLHLNWGSLVALKGNYFIGKSLDVSNPSDPTSYEKQLVYIPQNQSSFIAEVTPGIFAFNVALQYVGERFYTSDNSTSLSPYAITRVSALARVDAGSFEFLPRLSIDDLFDRRYEVVSGYPMPGRTYRLGLSLQFNQDR